MSRAVFWETKKMGTTAFMVLSVMLFSNPPVGTEFQQMNFCRDKHSMEYAINAAVTIGRKQGISVFNYFVDESHCWRKGADSFSEDDAASFVAVHIEQAVAYGYFVRKDESGQPVFVAGSMALLDPTAEAL